MDDGEVIFDEIFDGGCLVFLTAIEDGVTSSGVGFTKVDDKDSRFGFGRPFALSLLPGKRADLNGRVSPRFEGMTPIIELRFPGPTLCLPNALTDGKDDCGALLESSDGIDSRLDMDIEDILDDARLVVGDGMPSPSSMPKYCEDLEGDRE